MIDVAGRLRREAAIDRRAKNAAAQRCINEGGGKRGRSHGPLAVKLDADGNAIGHYTKCQRCIDTHRGIGPYANTKKTSRYA